MNATTITAYRISPIYGHPTDASYSMTPQTGHSINLPDTMSEQVQMYIADGCEIIDTDFGPALLYRPEGWHISLQEAVNMHLAWEA